MRVHRFEILSGSRLLYLTFSQLVSEPEKRRKPMNSPLLPLHNFAVSASIDIDIRSLLMYSRKPFACSHPAHTRRYPCLAASAQNAAHPPPPAASASNGHRTGGTHTPPQPFYSTLCTSTGSAFPGPNGSFLPTVRRAHWVSSTHYRARSLSLFYLL
jgi:hypothetical protein